MIKLDIRKCTKVELHQYMEGIGQPKFRTNQIFNWIWQRSATDFATMSNLPAALRARLENEFEFNPITEDKRQVSNDGTIKSRFKLHDGHLIETVLIPVQNDNRYTVCVSCQVGCSLTCAFCATGQMERVRNLDPAEIYDQVVATNALCLELYGHPLTNIVYMGMGEPLLAYKNVLDSIERITSPEGLNMSPRRITVSTAGIAKMIKKLADDDVKFNLALSLHAGDDVKRNEIMPINETNTLDVLMDAILYFYKKTGNRISYEYIAFSGFNDSIEDAKKLVRLCKIFPVKVNIIEYNPIPGMTWTKSPPDQIDRFAAYVRKHDIMITVRRSRGKDIDAACGQLANREI